MGGARVNPARRALLELCAASSDGYSPSGSDWPVVYWLHARGMLDAYHPHRLKPPRFAITEFGRTALKDESAIA